MLEAIFYLIVILCVFAGYKKGAVESGYYFISNGMAAYFSVWLLPFLLPLIQYVPGAARDYALPLLLIIAFALISFGVKYGIDKLIEEYPAMSSVPVVSGMPVVNKAFGALFGVYLGYAVAAFLLFVVSFAPYDIASLTGGDFSGSADARILAFSRRVNKVSDESWNTRQEEFLKEVAKKHRNKVKAAETAEEKADEEAAPAEQAQQPENPGPAAEGAAAEGTVINRIAARSDGAAAANQSRALGEMGDAPVGKKTLRSEQKAQIKREAAVFSLTVPLLKADGTSTQFKRELKLGIVLPEDGKVPVMIDAEVPHPVQREPKRRICKTVRLDLSLMEVEKVDSLPAGAEVKYSVVDVE